MHTLRTARLALLLAVLAGVILTAVPTHAQSTRARTVILMIADGWGANHIAATASYTGTAAPYASWTQHWMATYAAGGSYDPGLAWTDFSYAISGATDSAAAATALYTGSKTANRNISITADDSHRLEAISEKARATGMASGAVTTVQIGHATPGAWMAHNDDRGRGYAITDEGLWGNPNTTGTPADSTRYSGHFGPTFPALDVAIGGGHPGWNTTYVNSTMRDKLAAESGQSGAFTFVERVSGSADGGARLLAAANTPGVTRLAGLFGDAGGNIPYRLADGSGHDPENPTLAEMTTAALTVLNRDPNGFALLIEGGAVDWASHRNQMDWMVGELIGFDAAVQAVVDWVDAPDNGSSWDNTLLIVTGDHETGYLTAGPNQFPDAALGPVNAATLALEQVVASTGRRASWEDVNANAEIDDGETVYWAWNTGGHSNSLIPLYAKGVGADLFATLTAGTDPVRGAFVENTAVHTVMDAVTVPPLALTISPAANDSDLDLAWTDDASHQSYSVYRATTPYFAPLPARLIGAPVTAVFTDTDSPGTDILGDPSTNYFYLVQSENDPLGSVTSRHVGEFDFAIVPGG